MFPTRSLYKDGSKQLSMAMRLQQDIMNCSSSSCSSPTMSLASSSASQLNANGSKSVRFDKQIKISPLDNSGVNCVQQQQGNVNANAQLVQVQVHVEPPSASSSTSTLTTSKSKSILKDPICDGLRSVSGRHLNKLFLASIVKKILSSIQKCCSKC